MNDEFTLLLDTGSSRAGCGVASGMNATPTPSSYPGFNGEPGSSEWCAMWRMGGSCARKRATRAREVALEGGVGAREAPMRGVLEAFLAVDEEQR